MNRRVFENSQIYHIFNKSISHFKIFVYEEAYMRFLVCLNYYNSTISIPSLSGFLKRECLNNLPQPLQTPINNSVVKILAYCLMPDHYHLLIKVMNSVYVSEYIANIQNSYTRYINFKLHRKGPLWQSRFKSVPVISNEQLLHVSRYIHLNPTSSSLVKQPEDWQYSSYNQFLNTEILCNYLTEISIHSVSQYKKFVENRKNYQRTLKTLRRIRLD